MQTNVTVDEALAITLGRIPVMETEVCPLGDALNRTLGADLVAREDVPPFDNSGMDGFALRPSDPHAETLAKGTTLPVKGEIQAGTTPGSSIPTGTAVRIMTGAPVPDGTILVVEQERVAVKNGNIELTEPAGRGRNIRRKGEDIAKGSVVLRKGTVIKPPHLGVLASLGCTTVTVFRTPRAALVTTGNEIVDVGEIPGPGQIRNSNAFTLQGLLHSTGARLSMTAIARDDEPDLRRHLAEGLTHDLLITSGGISVGAYDLVLKVLQELGVEMLYWKVGIKPGGPAAFGVFHRSGKPVPVFALPGNPVSTAVIYRRFVHPALEIMMGRSETESPLRLRATLEEDLKKHDAKRHFLRGIVRNENGRLVVRTTGSQSSGVLTSMAKANCFIVIPEDLRSVAAGSEVEIELL